MHKPYYYMPLAYHDLRIKRYKPDFSLEQLFEAFQPYLHIMIVMMIVVNRFT